MGMNGLDVAGLRPFDLVIPFTIQKGEITGNTVTVTDASFVSVAMLWCISCSCALCR